MRFEELAEFDTKLTADVVEWRPNSNTLACATYFLDKDKSHRTGTIYILELTKNNNNDESSLDRLTTLHFDQSGILDLKWLDQTHLISIDSKNTLNLITLNDNNLKISKTIDLNNSLAADETTSPAVGLTLDYAKMANNAYKVVSSDTLGNIHVCTVGEQQKEMQRIGEARKCHDMEIWSLMIDKCDTNLVYSGADDCTLKMWDLRINGNRPILKCDIFEGGVTSILTPGRISAEGVSFLTGYGPDNVVCGSYDERVYVLDKRALKRSVLESEKMQGGVWKMKLHATRDLILCACMHTGVHLVDTARLQSVLYYDKHGLNSLAYGCDWSHIDSDCVATCSFYNNSLRVWKVFD